MSDGELITADQAGERLGVLGRTVRRWISDGHLRARMVNGRYLIDPADLPSPEAVRHSTPRRSPADLELDALSAIFNALEPLTKDQRERVWRWARDRFALDVL